MGRMGKRTLPKFVGNVVWMPYATMFSPAAAQNAHINYLSWYLLARMPIWFLSLKNPGSPSRPSWDVITSEDIRLPWPGLDDSS